MIYNTTTHDSWHQNRWFMKTTIMVYYSKTDSLGLQNRRFITIQEIVCDSKTNTFPFGQLLRTKKHNKNKGHATHDSIETFFSASPLSLPLSCPFAYSILLSPYPFPLHLFRHLITNRKRKRNKK